MAAKEKQERKPATIITHVIREDSDYLRIRELRAEEVNLSVSTIYALMAAGAFPQPILLGARGVAWIRGDIRKWKAEREANGPTEREANKLKMAADRAAKAKCETSPIQKAG